MPRTRVSAKRSTGGNAPRRELSRKGGGVEGAIAKAARTRPSPYPKTSASVARLAKASSQLSPVSSCDLQPLSSVGPPTLPSQKMPAVSGPGLYHHEVCACQRLISYILIIPIQDLLLCVLRWVRFSSALRLVSAGCMCQTPWGITTHA